MITCCPLHLEHSSLCQICRICVIWNLFWSIDAERQESKCQDIEASNTRHLGAPEKKLGPKHKHHQIWASLTPGCHGGGRGPVQETVWEWVDNAWLHSRATFALWHPLASKVRVRWVSQVCRNHFIRPLFLLLKLTKKLSCLSGTPSRSGNRTQPRHVGSKGRRKVKPIPDRVSSRLSCSVIRLLSCGHR